MINFHQPRCEAAHIGWVAGFITEDPNIFCDDQILMEVARPRRLDHSSAKGERMGAMRGMVGDYSLKRAKEFLDPEKGEKGREVYRSIILKKGTPMWAANNKHAHCD